MNKVSIIPHEKITKQQIAEIIDIKMNIWPFPFEEQYKWIINNLKDDDIHIYLKVDGKIVSYLNLISIMIEIDQASINGFGVGNVCSLEKSRGYGKEVLLQANNYINNNNRVGMLFCKKSLINFYIKLGWSVIRKSVFNQMFGNYHNEILVYNFPDEFSAIKYSGREF